MPRKELMLRESVSFIFQRGNKLYKINIGIEGGIITLEELHQDSKEPDILGVLTIKEK